MMAILGRRADVTTTTNSAVCAAAWTREEDKRVLEERPGFACQKVGRLRARVLEASRSLQTAAPGYRRVEVEAVNPANLAARA